MKRRHQELKEIGKPLFPSFNGRPHSKETKEIMSQNRKGKGTSTKNSQYGTMWITNGVDNAKINKESIIPQGWVRGRNIL